MDMMTQFVQVNWLAILACGVASMATGFLWYGPLFAKKWGELTGWTEEKIRASTSQQSMIRNYVLVFIFALIEALVLANILKLTMANADASNRIVGGLMMAVLTWVGFVAMTMGANDLFERRPLALYGINTGYHLVNFLVFSVILVLMP